eukprot:m51a1_g9210 hypothetical protein (1016) ;mRNA; f:23267-26896
MSLNKLFFPAALLALLGSLASAQKPDVVGLCLQHALESGFICLPDTTSDYVRCDMNESVAVVMQCPPPTVCSSPALVFTTASPCTLPRAPVCGNGAVEEGEQCEAGGLGCLSNCLCAPGWFPASPATKDCVKQQQCGNGVVEAGEECEIGGFGCNQQCKCSPGFFSSSPAARDCNAVPTCGNGVIEAGEQCEISGVGCVNCNCTQGFAPAVPPRRDCIVIPTLPQQFCGDQNVSAELGEQCEIGGVGCTSNCKCFEGFFPTVPPTRNCVSQPTSVCGNGVIDAGEECEIGGLGCTLQCNCSAAFEPTVPPSFNCTLRPACGNTVLEAGEQCELGGLGCNASCLCSPGFVPSQPLSASCVLAPAVPACGDGQLGAGEECEVGGFGCDAQCKCNAAFAPQTPVSRDCQVRPFCGNGVVDLAAEDCEIGGVGCGLDCKCVAGFVAKSPAQRDCEAKATLPPAPACGNGVVEANEQCEIGGVGCSSICTCMSLFAPRQPATFDCQPTGPRCGNGVVEAGEQCELGGTGCNTSCACEAPQWVPAAPVASRDCERAPLNLTALCELVDSGFFCLPGRPTEYLRCHLLELVAFVMSCPRGTVCSVATLVPTIDGPCVNATAEPATLPTPPPACGNGALNAGEQCELGGAGCNASCLCLAGFLPAVPSARDCVPFASVGEPSAVCAAAGSDGFFCPAAVQGGAETGEFVRCVNGSAVRGACAPGTLCTALGFTQATPCNFSAPRCGNGVVEGAEECEAGGAGCNASDCTCRADFEPARPAAADCVPAFARGSPAAATLNATCAAINATGFFCPAALLNDSSLPNTSFAQCGPDGAFAGLQRCALDLQCTTPNFTRSNPCARVPRCGDMTLDAGEQCEADGLGCNATTCTCLPGYAPVSGSSACAQLFPPVCGNGVVEANETCEAGGLGCNATTCQCESNYTRAFPASRDCVGLPVAVGLGANATAVCAQLGGSAGPAFGVCVAGVETLFLLCDPAAAAATAVQCPPGTTCTARFLSPMPCARP